MLTCAWIMACHLGCGQREPKGSLFKKLRHRLNANPDQRAAFTAQLQIPRAWLTSANLVLGFRYILYSTLILSCQTCLAFRISLSPLAGGLHLFCSFFSLFQSLSLAVMLPALKVGIWKVEEMKVSVTVQKVLCSIHFLCEPNHEISLFMTDMIFKGCLANGNRKIGLLS